VRRGNAVQGDGLRPAAILAARCKTGLGKALADKVDDLLLGRRGNAATFETVIGQQTDFLGNTGSIKTALGIGGTRHQSKSQGQSRNGRKQAHRAIPPNNSRVTVESGFSGVEFSASSGTKKNPADPKVDG